MAHAPQHVAVGRGFALKRARMADSAPNGVTAEIICTDGLDILSIGVPLVKDTLRFHEHVAAAIAEGRNKAVHISATAVADVKVDVTILRAVCRMLDFKVHILTIEGPTGMRRNARLVAALSDALRECSKSANTVVIRDMHLESDTDARAFGKALSQMNCIRSLSLHNVSFDPDIDVEAALAGLARESLERVALVSSIPNDVWSPRAVGVALQKCSSLQTLRIDQQLPEVQQRNLVAAILSAGFKHLESLELRGFTCGFEFVAVMDGKTLPPLRRLELLAPQRPFMARYVDPWPGDAMVDVLGGGDHEYPVLRHVPDLPRRVRNQAAAHCVLVLSSLTKFRHLENLDVSGFLWHKHAALEFLEDQALEFCNLRRLRLGRRTHICDETLEACVHLITTLQLDMALEDMFGVNHAVELRALMPEAKILPLRSALTYVRRLPALHLRRRRRPPPPAAPMPPRRSVRATAGRIDSTTAARARSDYYYY